MTHGRLPGADGVQVSEQLESGGGRQRDIIVVSVIALVWCGVLAGSWFVSIPEPSEAKKNGPAIGLLSPLYDPPDRAIEAALTRGDGQVFAAMATDPLARRDDVLAGGGATQAYRYQRPAYGWAGWGASGGNADLVPWALVVVTVVAGAALATASSRLLVGAGVDPRWGLIVLAAPGLWINLTWVGPETLGTALLVAGLVALRRQQPDETVPWVAVALFAAAGFCRETLLLLPGVVFVGCVARREWVSSRRVALAAVPYFLWACYLRLSIGHWPTEQSEGRLSLLPFSGFVRSSELWSAGDVVVIVVIAGLVAGALLLGRGSGLRVMVLAELGLAAMLGEKVWTRFPDFSRILLPLTVLSVLAILAGHRAPAERVEVERSAPDALRPPVSGAFLRPLAENRSEPVG
jgi:hypothetical protein